MTKKFSIDDALTIRTQSKLSHIGDRKARDVCRTVALGVLQRSYEQDKPYDASTFIDLFDEVAIDLTSKQQDLCLAMYLDAAPDYLTWREANKAASVNAKSRGKAKDYGTPRVHGGSGYTGRLEVGGAAPYGAESYQSDEDPRAGIKSWALGLTHADGAGAGHSMGELGGKKAGVWEPRNHYEVPRGYERPENEPTDQELRAVLDKTDGVAKFVGAFLKLYDRNHVIMEGNTTVDTRRLSSPDEIADAANLDVVYRQMKEIDRFNYLRPKRTERFLGMALERIEKAIDFLPTAYARQSESAKIEALRHLKATKAELELIRDTERGVVKPASESVASGIDQANIPLTEPEQAKTGQTVRAEPVGPHTQRLLERPPPDQSAGLE